MTLQTLLMQRMRWIRRALYLGAGLCVAGILFAGPLGDEYGLLLFITGIAVLVPVAILAQYHWLRCPRCRGNLGVLLTHEIWLPVDTKVQFCPFCGVDLHEELPQDTFADA